jgi:1-acyl-sn-glycerol-3-phosphate acyltransferase
MLEKTLYVLWRSAAGAYARAMLNLDVVRHAPLPAGPKIIAANHPSTIDPILIPLLAREQISIVIDGALFDAPLLGGYLRRAGQVPALSHNGAATVEQARRLLAGGRSVAIFPEGHVSPLQGGFCEPRTGTARLALSSGAPVIPVGIYLPRERIRVINLKFGGDSSIAKWYARGPYAITVGKPLYLQGEVENRPHVRALSERIMQHIIHLAHESALRVQTSLAFAPDPIRRLAASGGVAQTTKHHRTGVVR